VKKKISIIVLCFFILTIFTGGAAAKKNDPPKGYGYMKNFASEKMKPLPGFIDIDGDWARDEINKAAQKGFMKGYGDGKFQPNKPITCLETIVALMGTLEQEGAIDLDEFDVDSYDSLLGKIPGWGKVYVAAAIDEGILLEIEMDGFNPNQGIKRYQAAIYFARLTENGYGEYFEGIVEDVSDVDDIDLDEILEEIEAAIDELDEVIDEYEDKYLDEDEDENKDIYKYKHKGKDKQNKKDKGELTEDVYEQLNDFGTTLKEFKDQLEELEEEALGRKEIGLINNELGSLMTELKNIMKDEEMSEELDEVMKRLNEIKSELSENKVQNKNLFQYFDENQIPCDGIKAVKWVQKLRIMMGDADGRFSPMRVVKRNELAAMLNRLDDNYFCQQDGELIKGILDDLDYDEDHKIFIMSIIDEDGNTVDEIEFTDEDKLFYDGELVIFDDDDIDEDEAALEDIETGGKIKIYLNNQGELVWTKIYPPEED
jgi:hypothetical protein